MGLQEIRVGGHFQHSQKNKLNDLAWSYYQYARVITCLFTYKN